MNKQIRNLGIFLTLCYVALFAQLNRVTVFDQEALQSRPGNNRQAIRDFEAARGTISTSDGVLLAESVETQGPEARFERQRTYPQGDLFAHITGYFNPLSVGTTGIEREYNDELAGRNLDINPRTLDDVFVEQDRVGDLTLTLRADVQQAARDALGERRGSVVAIDPRSGALLALWSFPTYDPNALATHDFPRAGETAEVLGADPATDPRLARSYQERFFPGSTFKVVTAAAGVESGRVTPRQPDYPQSSGYSAPGVSGQPVGNFGDDTCGGTLFTILQESCNTAFAQMGVQDAGPEVMVRTAEAFGFNQEVPIDLPGAAESHFPTEVNADQLLAQYSIGQNDVQATPLQMALVAAAVANGGEVMRPHVLQEIRDNDDQELIRETEPETWTTAMTPQSAGLLREGMQSVVNDGTADRLREALTGDLAGYDVGGKTGTAQIGSDPPRSHAWIVGFAGPPGGEAEVAVAVLVEGAEGVSSDQTGGQVAAPIASQVLAAALRPPQAPAGGEADSGGDGS
jgi:peptidoglycan glycosyltransferase